MTRAWLDGARELEKEAARELVLALGREGYGPALPAYVELRSRMKSSRDVEPMQRGLAADEPSIRRVAEGGPPLSSAKGDPHAMRALSRILEMRARLRDDRAARDEARSWLVRAAEAGDPVATLTLAAAEASASRPESSFRSVGVADFHRRAVSVTRPDTPHDGGVLVSTIQVAPLGGPPLVIISPSGGPR